VNDGTFRIDATISIAEVADLLGLRDLPHGDYLTLAGFVRSQLQHVAQADAASRRHLPIAGKFSTFG
jgi:CBS domain containing-hemolysin-like protein